MTLNVSTWTRYFLIRGLSSSDAFAACGVRTLGLQRTGRAGQLVWISSLQWDDQAVEEALLVKEVGGGEIVVVGFEDPNVELSLSTPWPKVPTGPST